MFDFTFVFFCRREQELTEKERNIADIRSNVQVNQKYSKYCRYPVKYPGKPLIIRPKNIQNIASNVQVLIFCSYPVKRSGFTEPFLIIRPKYSKYLNIKVLNWNLINHHTKIFKIFKYLSNIRPRCCNVHWYLSGL